MNNGLFVTFEGLDGCGKSTVVRQVASRLTSIGYSVQTLPEFSTSAFGDYLRHALTKDKFLRDDSVRPSALTQACAIIADLLYFSEHEVAPRIFHSQIVLKDRFVESAISCQLPNIVDEYGNSEISDLARDWMNLLFRLVPTPPDLTFYLDVPIAERVRRIQSRTRHVDERDTNIVTEDDISVFDKREAVYESLFFGEAPRGIIIDNNRDLASTVTDVERVILNRLQA